MSPTRLSLLPKHYPQNKCDDGNKINDGQFWLSLAHRFGGGVEADNATAGRGTVGLPPVSTRDPMRRSLSVAIDHDASADQVRAAIQELCGTAAGSVHVDRSRLPGSQGGYTWRVLFRAPTTAANGDSGGSRLGGGVDVPASSWAPPPRLALHKETISAV